MKDLEAKLEHTFSDEKVLLSAMTHGSYVNEHPGSRVPDNERLEFLGDAVLDYLAAEYLYKRCPTMREGHLTALRAALVRTETLAALAEELDLGRYLRLGRGEEDSGGRTKPTNLCAAFEAVIGAMALDAGIDRTRELLHSLIQPVISSLLESSPLKDAKTQLQELSQAELHIVPAYETVAELGPDHAREFIVVVRMGSEIWGEGRGPTKQLAQQEAAQAAIQEHFPDTLQQTPEVEDRTECI